MDRVITILKEEIIKLEDLKLKYQEIQLQCIKDNNPNDMVNLMIEGYSKEISSLIKAINILNEAKLKAKQSEPD